MFGSGRVVGGRADAVTELAFAHAAFPVVLLAGEDLREAVVVEQHRHLVAAPVALEVGEGCGDAPRRGQARARLAAARARDVAGHGLQQHGGRRAVVAHVALRAGVEVLEMDRLGGAVQPRELADGVGRDRADGSRPLGGLLDAVLAFAHAVGAPFLEAFLVDPRVDELVVDQVLFVEHLRHGQHHGQVGAGTDGYPLVGQDLGRLRVARVDDDGLAAVLVRKLHVVRRRPEPGHHRVHAPHDEELGVEDVGRLEAGRGRALAARDLGQVDAQMKHLAGRMPRRGVLAPGAEAGLPPGGQGKPVLLEAGVLRMEDAVGAVLLLDLDHLLRNGVERFFPADGHEVAFARTLLAHALHGVQKPRLGVELLLPRMAHGAGAHLHVALPDVLPAAVLAAVVLVDGVVRLDRDDLAVLDVALQDTCRVPAAVRRARRVEDAFPFPPCTARIDDALFVHRFLLWPCGAVRAKGVARPTSHERPMSVALDVARLSCSGPVGCREARLRRWEKYRWSDRGW